MKKKTITALATLILAAAVSIASYLSGENTDLPSLNTQTSTAQSQSSVSTAEKSEGSAASTREFPEDLLKPQVEGIAPFGFINATVTKVSDGDTIRVDYNGQEYKVRLLDIDTPESVKAGVEEQPYSQEASTMTKETLTGKNVKLIFEKDTTDQYDRLLAYIILADGTFYNAFLVENGYAICVFYTPNTLLRDYFGQLQDSAIAGRKGFWQLPEDQRPFVENDKGGYIAAYKLKEKAS